MEKLVSTTFKILFFSMLFSFLLDTSLLLVQIIGVHTKVSNITGIIQTEISRNNYMPTDMANTFEEFFHGIIIDNYKIMEAGSITTNFSSLTEDDAKEYGEIQELEIDVYLFPIYGYIRDGINAQGEGWFARGAKAFEIHLNYDYNVPCLRYLK